MRKFPATHTRARARVFVCVCVCVCVCVASFLREASRILNCGRGMAGTH